MTRRDRSNMRLRRVGGAVGDVLGPEVGGIVSAMTSGYGALAVTLGAAYVGMKALADEAKRLRIEANQTGISVGTYVMLERVSRQTGLNLGAVGQGMESARQGAFGSPASVYGRLGLSSQDMSIETLARAFDKLKDPVERARAEIELFGQAAPEMAAAFRLITNAGTKFKNDAARNLALEQSGPSASWQTAGKWLGTEFALSARATGLAAGQGDWFAAITGYGTGKGGMYYEQALADLNLEAKLKQGVADTATKSASGMRKAASVLGGGGASDTAGLAGAMDIRSSGGYGQVVDYIYKMSQSQDRLSETNSILREIAGNTARANQRGSEIN